MPTQSSLATPGEDAPKLLVGLIGAGIQRSLTPRLHEEEARCQGLRLHYQLIDLDADAGGAARLPTLIDAARYMGFAGLNITYPCKQTVIPLLDDLSPDARQLGAVNTVVCRGLHMTGHNTDWSGFATAFARALPDAPLGDVVQLGAGGAGAAVAHAALRMGARRLTLIDRDAARAETLAHMLNDQHGAPRVRASTDVASALAGADGLIHATPTGMDKLPGLPLPAEFIRPGLWVADIVYFPIETALLRLARQRGCRTVDGGGMAVWQAVGAFELFTGIKPDAARMEAHFRRMLAHDAMAVA
ncbi:MAG: shikimate dehydrogenase [Rhodocyclaceae bacterium]